MHGFYHIEIPVKNAEKLGPFYADVFGWEITPFPGMDYTLYKPGDGVGGGFDRENSPVAEGGITLYIEVEDIDAILKAVVDKGGKVMKPKFAIPNVGQIALFTDPDGNRMGLWLK